MTKVVVVTIIGVVVIAYCIFEYRYRKRFLRGFLLANMAKRHGWVFRNNPEEFIRTPSSPENPLPVQEHLRFVFSGRYLDYNFNCEEYIVEIPLKDNINARTKLSLLQLSHLPNCDVRFNRWLGKVTFSEENSVVSAALSPSFVKWLSRRRISGRNFQIHNGTLTSSWDSQVSAWKFYRRIRFLVKVARRMGTSS